MKTLPEFRVFNEAGVIDPLERFQELQGRSEVWSIRAFEHRSQTIYSTEIESREDLDRVLWVLRKVNAGRGVPPLPN